MKYVIVSLTVSCFITTMLVGQDLSLIGKQKPVSINGAVSLNQVLYSGSQSHRDPYSYYASGNVNFSLYGWAIPLSFNVANQNAQFRQPFNQFSLHPSYKWITAHLGYTSLSFSPYTLNGHIFLGGAVDVAPEGNWRISAMYGRFLKAIERDTLNPASTPAFKRMGYGFKAGYSNGDSFAELILFHAEDDPASINYDNDNINFPPAENLVISIGAGKSLFRNCLLKAEIASSALTSDVRAQETESASPLQKVAFLYKPRLSSSFYNAIKTSFDYSNDIFALGISYERIDPQYRTLGAYYFNNDLESIAANGTVSMMEGRITMAASAGAQRDNVDNSKMNTTRRAVGSFNVNYASSERLNFSLSYSNFQTYTNIRSQFLQINQLTPYENLDTLNFIQIAQSGSAAVTYQLGRDETRKQNVNIHASMQNAADTQGNVPQNSGMRFYNFNSSYVLNLLQRNMVLSMSINAAVNKGAGGNIETYGPVASVSRSFLQKTFRTTLSFAYNKTFNNGLNVTAILNGRLNASITLRKKHNLSVSAVAMNRENRRVERSKPPTEFTGAVGYNYFFGRNG